MPKFMTYQRPTPVKTGNWGGNKSTRNPFQPVRRVPVDGQPATPERTDLVRLPDVLKRS